MAVRDWRQATVIMRLLSKDGVAVIPGHRRDATGEEWVGRDRGGKDDLRRWLRP